MRRQKCKIWNREVKWNKKRKGHLVRGREMCLVQCADDPSSNGQQLIPHKKLKLAVDSSLYYTNKDFSKPPLGQSNHVIILFLMIHSTLAEHVEHD